MKLSVLVLTFNRKKLVSQLVPDIINKVGVDDVEFMFWDNNSTDGTFDWIESFKLTINKPIRVFPSEKNYGIEATNFLAKEAVGSYVLKVDSDLELPRNYGKKLIEAYEEAKQHVDDKLLFLSYDMQWGTKTFATRSGMSLYKPPTGKIIQYKDSKILIHFKPSKWLVNGACRLSERGRFLEYGQHPVSIKYGVDYKVSKKAEKNGFYIGYYSDGNPVIHKGTNDTKSYRKFKDEELSKHGCPKDV